MRTSPLTVLLQQAQRRLHAALLVKALWIILPRLHSAAQCFCVSLLTVLSDKHRRRLGNLLVLIAVISLCTTVQFCAKPAAFQPFFVCTLHLRTDAVRADGGKRTAVISAAAAAAPLPQKTKIAVVSTDRHRIHTSPRRLHPFRLDAAAVLHAARLARLFFILYEDFARKFRALSAEAPPPYDLFTGIRISTRQSSAASSQRTYRSMVGRSIWQYSLCGMNSP